MSRPLKVLGGVALAALVLAACLVAALHAIGGSWMAASYEVAVEPVEVPSDSASVAWGKHLFEAIGACSGCHGEDLGGRVLVDSPIFATWQPPNLTSGEGGVVGDYTAADWVRTIRHGVSPEGRALIMMPATAYYHFSDADVGALIAYIRSAPPVDRTMGSSTLNVIGRAAMVMGGAPFLVGRTMDHEASRMPRPEAGVSVAYGDYLARVCAACHGRDLAGDVGPDLRPSAGYAHVDLAKFRQILRTGITAAGQPMDPDVMPWPSFARMTDAELDALWTYLASLPAD